MPKSFLFFCSFSVFYYIVAEGGENREGGVRRGHEAREEAVLCRQGQRARCQPGKRVATRLTPYGVEAIRF